MPLDPVIAQGFRGIELQNPVENYMRLQQMQSAQQQNQLNALKMQEYQREVETTNRLRGLDPRSPGYIDEVTRINPQIGSELQLRRSQQAAAERAAAASDAEARSKNLTYWQTLARDAARTPTDQVVTSLARRAVELGIRDENTTGVVLQAILEMPPERRSEVLSKYGAAAVAEPATPADIAAMKALGFPLTQAGYEQFRAAQRQNRLKTPEEEAQDIRIAQASRPPAPPKEDKPDPRTVVAFRETDAAGNVTLINKFGEIITPSAPVKGKPSATFEKTTAQRKQLNLDLDRAIVELTNATKKDGLIDQSTGSGAGRLRDIGAGFFGQATSGAIAGGKIAPIADLVLKMVPRFEGPQSDKDTTSYKEAAGQLANTTLPNEIRKQAGLEILRLMKERKNQFVTSDMAAEGTGAGAAPTTKPSLDDIFGPKK